MSLVWRRMRGKFPNLTGHFLYLLGAHVIYFTKPPLICQIDNIHYQVCDEIDYPFQTPMAIPLKFGNEEVTSTHPLQGMWFIIHNGLKLIHVS